MRRTLGTAVFSGMIGVTLFGIFLTPVFFYVIDGVGRRRICLPRPASIKIVLRVGLLAESADGLGICHGHLFQRLSLREKDPASVLHDRRPLVLRGHGVSAN